MNRLLSVCLMCMALPLGTVPVFAADAPAKAKHTTARTTKPAKAKPVATKPAKQAKPTKEAPADTAEDELPPATSMSDGSATTVEGDAEPVLPGSKIFPWYGSLKKTEVNVRSGPGNKYPILWIYQRAGYPVQVLTRYDNYYKVRDVEGEEGWVYIGMVSKRVTALVGGEAPTNLHKKPDPASPVVARLAPDLAVEMEEECETTAGQTFCKVNAMGTKGWVDKSALQMVE